MIRVIVEMVPRGDESRKTTLATIVIANDGTGTQEAGNYNGTLKAEYTPSAGRSGHVHGFRRERQSVMSLVGAFLKQWGHTKQGKEGDMPGTAKQVDLL